MTITFGTVLLCDGASRGVGKYVGVKSLRIGDQRTVQAVPVIGATSQKVKGWGNRVVNISFAVEREHATVAEAEAHCVALYATLANQADLKFVNPTATFADAALVTSEHYYAGVRTYHSYQFLIGAAA